MNKKFKSIAAYFLPLAFFLNTNLATPTRTFAQQAETPNLEEKLCNNSLISIIGNKILPEEQANFYIQIDKKELKFKLFQRYDEGDTLLLESPVALGRKGWTTPSGNFYLRRIINMPIWYPPKWAKTKKIPKPGKDNPYGLWMSELSTQNEKGTHDFSVSGDSMIRIHSTDEPVSIGKYASHGCIRLFPEIAEEFFPALLHYLSHKEPKKNARGIIYPLEKAIPLQIE